MDMREQILAIAGPVLTCMEVAQKVGCAYNYARSTAKAAGVTLRAAKVGRPGRKVGDLLDLIRETFEYDPKTGVVSRDGKEAGWVAVHGYRVVMCHGRKVYAHRIAWAITYGSLPSQKIDHINGDGLDNRIENLRECTHQQNLANTGKSKRVDVSSKYKGVSLRRQTGRWRARITVDGRERAIGNYDTEEAAAAAYADAARKLHGEFARAA